MREVIKLGSTLWIILALLFSYLKRNDNFDSHTTIGCTGWIFGESLACGQPCGENNELR